MSWRTIGRSELTDRLADLIAARPAVVRVAVDGAPCTGPDALAAELVEPLRVRGRRAVHVPASGFWRDASLRLEYGRQDVQSYLNWLDHDALRREVLVPAVAARTYLPSLRDPATNRSTRAEPQPLDDSAVVLVSGAFLLGLGLPFDVVVHLHAPADQLARDTPEQDAWTLPAYAEYDATVGPVDVADVNVRVGRRHPAVLGL